MIEFAPQSMGSSMASGFIITVRAFLPADHRNVTDLKEKVAKIDAIQEVLDVNGFTGISIDSRFVTKRGERKSQAIEAAATVTVTETPKPDPVPDHPVPDPIDYLPPSEPLPREKPDDPFAIPPLLDRRNQRSS